MRICLTTSKYELWLKYKSRQLKDMNKLLVLMLLEEIGGADCDHE